MRISGLEEATGVPRATLKFYLREGLLHPGRAVSRTQAEYDQNHVERVRLIRGLTEVGDLSLENVRRVLAALDDSPSDRLGIMAVSQMALVGALDCEPVSNPESAGAPGPAGEHESADTSPPQSRAQAWLTERGWRVDLEDPEVSDLDRAWTACDEAGIVFDATKLAAYADAVEAIASIDLDSVPDDPKAAVRQVVLGTVLIDPVLRSLRRLAQQHEAITRFGDVEQRDEGGSGAGSTGG